jgi:hypothetical protein
MGGLEVVLCHFATLPIPRTRAPGAARAVPSLAFLPSINERNRAHETGSRRHSLLALPPWWHSYHSQVYPGHGERRADHRNLISNLRFLAINDYGLILSKPNRLHDSEE